VGDCFSFDEIIENEEKEEEKESLKIIFSHNLIKQSRSSAFSFEPKDFL